MTISNGVIKWIVKRSDSIELDFDALSHSFLTRTAL